jgi:uncharacterized membrane protein
MTSGARRRARRFAGRGLFTAGALALAGACSGGGVTSGPSPSGSAAAPLVCDVTLPTSCTDSTLRYADVAPIFEQRCLGCHSGDPGGPWPLTAYEHVADWASAIRGQMAMCSMPPVDAGIAMPADEREKILLWIRCGARE